jgi:tripartite-type tricarboxylate transporter receptor subunit TctC
MRIAWMLIALAPALLPNVARAQVNTEHDALSRRFATLVAPPPPGSSTDQGSRSMPEMIAGKSKHKVGIRADHAS